MDRAPVNYSSAADRATVDRQSFEDEGALLSAIDGGLVQDTPIGTDDNCVIGVAEPRRSLCYHIQDRLQVGRRGSDRPQDFTGRGLARQRLSQLPLQLGDPGRGFWLGFWASSGHACPFHSPGAPGAK